MTAVFCRAALLDARTNELVDAAIYDGIGKPHLADWRTKWRPAMAAAAKRLKAKRRARPESAHWDWGRKLEPLKGLLSYRGFAAVADGETQGLMLLDLTAHVSRIPDARGRMGLGLVYVEFLESAPWNQPGLVSAVRYRGVGSVLIAAAAMVSEGEGFKGRFGLHALPQSEGFYRDKIGMRDFGPDPDYDGRLHYFEASADCATAFLTRTGGGS